MDFWWTIRQNGVSHPTTFSVVCPCLDCKWSTQLGSLMKRNKGTSICSLTWTEMSARPQLDRFFCPPFAVGVGSSRRQEKKKKGSQPTSSGIKKRIDVGLVWSGPPGLVCRGGVGSPMKGIMLGHNFNSPPIPGSLSPIRLDPT